MKIRKKILLLLYFYEFNLAAGDLLEPSGRSGSFYFNFVAAIPKKADYRLKQKNMYFSIKIIHYNFPLLKHRS